MLFHILALTHEVRLTVSTELLQRELFGELKQRRNNTAKASSAARGIREELLEGGAGHQHVVGPRS